MQADSGRNLLIAWIALSAITLVSLWIGLRGAGDALAPDALLSTAAIVIMLVKVRLIFRQFMEVGHAPVLLGRLHRHGSEPISLLSEHLADLRSIHSTAENEPARFDITTTAQYQHVCTGGLQGAGSDDRILY